MEVADWEAKLLRIEQLQIELEVIYFSHSIISCKIQFLLYSSYCRLKN